MSLDMSGNKGSPIERQLEERALCEEEQGIIDALERYLSRRCPQPPPLMPWMMW